MKILLTIIFLSLLSSPCWSETFDDLVQRDGLYFKKFSEVPFSGKVNGLRNGSIKNGEEEGTWIRYHDNGQLYSKGNYKNGLEHGAWVFYYSNGLLRFKGNYKNGEEEGAWVFYFNNGQLWSKSNYKNGKEDGAQVRYYTDGTLDRERSGTFKNGYKIR